MTERDLFVEVKRDGTPIDVEGWACASIDEAMHRSTMVVAKCQLQRYIPAPTWRPIAEMPKEWRDGRPVLLSSNIVPGCGPFVGQWWRDGDGEDSWWCAVDATEWRDQPTHYLDLTIPEVPRG